MFLLLMVFATCIISLYWYRTSNRTTHLLKKAPGFAAASAQAADEPKRKLLSPPRQPWEYILVLDVEATCVAGTDFNWPNEIIVRSLCSPLALAHAFSYWHSNRNGP
jgi:hypothetical protein